MHSTATRYLRTILIASIGMIAAVLALTLLVDPYGTAPFHITIPKVNAVRTERASVDRLVKPYDIILRQPKTLLIGTSRVKEGLDPAALDGTALAPAYNAGIDFLTVPGTADLLRFVLPRTPSVRVVLIEANFQHFYSGPRALDMPHGAADLMHDYVSMFLSHSAVAAALRTVAQNKSYQGFNQWLHPDGLVEIWPQDFEYDKEHFINHVINPATRTNRFRIRERQIQWFADIGALCERHHVRCEYFIAPYNPLDLAQWAVAGQWEALEEAKRFMVRHGTVWDFSLYSDVTDYRNAHRYWWDINHFNLQVGGWMLRIMAGKRPPDAPAEFGLQLTRDNLPVVLTRWSQDRDRWLATNSDLKDRVARALNRN